jgi:hypothetical protein
MRAGLRSDQRNRSGRAGVLSRRPAEFLFAAEKPHYFTYFFV